MADDILPLLTRFHREVLLPDVQRVVQEAVGGLEERMDAQFRDVLGHLARSINASSGSKPSTRCSRSPSGGSRRGWI